MKIMVVGDTHGYTKCLTDKLNIAGKLKIQHVIVVGDFGLWTHEADGHEFLDRVNAAAEANNLSVYAVPGNHENHDHWEWFVNNMPTNKGFAMVRRRVLLSPKVNNWRWDNKTFAIAGGAVSIDKDYRLARERGGIWHDRDSGYAQHMGKGTGARTLYWPNEQLTDEDVNKVASWHKTNVDYLFTHDCSNRTPFYARLKPDMDSQIHRQRIDQVLDILKPKMHFHGHMHNQFDWENMVDGGYVRTFGLECNSDPNSWGVLDTSENRFFWPDEVEGWQE